MFILAELRNLVKLHPRGFNKDIDQQIQDELNHKLANRILIDVGLCISVYDILEIGESHILPGDGAAHTKVKFRMLVFRPWIEEMLVGKIKSSTKDGVNVTLGFFDQIFIPASQLQNPSRYEEKDNVWVWQYPIINEEGEQEGHHDLYMDIGDQIRFKVESEKFTDLGPKRDNKGKDSKGEGDGDREDSAGPEPSYSITATISEDGLGVVSWWS
eukprot:TRINITY_DN14750_c0_g1_i1.p1 TRINITY_DN14750_c0_g1~~TRINITY_DN14750_c0_g1_i1.p1  ORF type:complete len:214 (+),score=61.43 TRINITY_DN14750_c0_g1_i1:107-748(+)